MIGEGPYRTSNQGATWEPCNVGLEGASISAISVSRTDPDHVYAASNVAAGAVAPGIYVSKSGGR